MDQQKKRIEWVQDKIFQKDGSKLAVIVKKLPFHRPKYSLEIGTMIEGRLMKFVNVESHGMGRIEINSVKHILVELITSAEEYILSESQKAEDITIAWKIEREQAALNQGKKETTRTGKTERERQKKKQKLASNP